MTRVLGNYLRMYRKKTGLSQRELGLLIGYKNKWQVSKHERSDTIPPLLIALAYQVVFRKSVSELFGGIHTSVAQAVENSLRAFEDDLQNHPPKKRSMISTAQKLEWLAQRNA